MASRKEEKERLRAERLKREEEASRKNVGKRKAGVIAGVIAVVAVVAAVAVVALASGGGDKSPSKSTESNGDFPDGPVPAAVSITESDDTKLAEVAKAAGCTLTNNPNYGANHKDPPYKFKYKNNPATSGTHVPTPAPDGEYTDAPTEPELVHSLEHGRIEFMYQKAKLADAQLGSLKKLYDDAPNHMIITPAPRPGSFAVAGVAWDWSLTCPSVNEKTFEALRHFTIVRIDQGPEKVQ